VYVQVAAKDCVTVFVPSLTFTDTVKFPALANRIVALFVTLVPRDHV
jgi:hypothetical protein